MKERETKAREKAYSNISVRSFVTVVALLVAVLIFCGSLSYFVPQGAFERDGDNNIIPGTYQAGEVRGVALWRVITAPVRVFASEDGLTILMISFFLLVMSGVFNLLDKTGGIKTFIAYIMRSLRDNGGPVVCITVLLFMLFGSLFGMFEELVTLLPHGGLLRLLHGHHQSLLRGHGGAAGRDSCVLRRVAPDRILCHCVSDSVRLPFAVSEKAPAGSQVLSHL